MSFAGRRHDSRVEKRPRVLQDSDVRSWSQRHSRGQEPGTRPIFSPATVPARRALSSWCTFLFGADAKPQSIFRSAALSEWTFSASVDLSRRACSISRSGKRFNRVQIDGDIEGWPVEGQRELLNSSHQFSNDQWKDVLGALWFGLPADIAADRFSSNLPVAVLLRRKAAGE